VPVLDEADLAFWREHGYVVLHDAVPPETREATAQALWERLGADPEKPETWYRRRDHGIMVQYFQHPAFEANRRSPRIHKAFSQLWGHADLWCTTDRVGFNPPVRPGFKFAGPGLHWDVSVKTPIPLGTQGILYLTDTPPEQGAFTLVPGFQRWGEAWLNSLPRGTNPRTQDLHALGAIPVGGRAGDLVIWHQALPHGASPNRGTRPRLVQYINMFPARIERHEEWI
jgi:ectoine hydroxylase-related dioxygenase (phytanoyl-CoA dioxygenase family)